MKMLAGLGNPGFRYQETRHNLGFAVLDSIASGAGASFGKDRHRAEAVKVELHGEVVLLVKPQTYMNLSGEAVAPIMRWHRIETGDLLVVCDDINLDEGRLRFRSGGGDGGHKGLASVIQALGTSEVQRLRVGVGAPVLVPAEDWVLRRYTEDEARRFEKVADYAAKAAHDWVMTGTKACMNEYNGPGLSGAGRDGSEESR